MFAVPNLICTAIFSSARVSYALSAVFSYYLVLSIFDCLFVGTCQEEGVRHVVFGGAEELGIGYIAVVFFHP